MDVTNARSAHASDQTTMQKRGGAHSGRYPPPPTCVASPTRERKRKRHMHTIHSYYEMFNSKQGRRRLCEHEPRLRQRVRSDNQQSSTPAHDTRESNNNTADVNEGRSTTRGPEKYASRDPSPVIKHPSCTPNDSSSDLSFMLAVREQPSPELTLYPSCDLQNTLLQAGSLTKQQNKMFIYLYTQPRTHTAHVHRATQRSSTGWRDGGPVTEPPTHRHHASTRTSQARPLPC
ncbi:unnamed protein product [Ectocarpus sp. 12 AP-2014]